MFASSIPEIIELVGSGSKYGGELKREHGKRYIMILLMKSDKDWNSSREKSYFSQFSLVLHNSLSFRREPIRFLWLCDINSLWKMSKNVFQIPKTVNILPSIFFMSFWVWKMSQLERTEKRDSNCRSLGPLNDRRLAFRVGVPHRLITVCQHT